MANRFLDGNIVSLDGQAQVDVSRRVSRTIPIFADVQLLHLIGDLHLQQSLDIVLFQERLGCLMQRFGFSERFLPLLPSGQGLNGSLGFLQTAAQASSAALACANERMIRRRSCQTIG